MSAGVIISIKDLVVRAQFDDDWPAVGEIITVDNGNATKLLVDHLEPGGIAMCLNILTERNIQKGMSVERTKRGIEIPVGELTIGRILNAVGDPLDGLPPISGENLQYKDILKLPPTSTNFEIQKPEILETGIKVIDFFTPFRQRPQDWHYWWCRCGQDGVNHGAY
jgi:F-type H+/Na+-transporting ATPase subunit beta